MKRAPAPAHNRSDRPHVFLKQERTACAGCGTPGPVRTILKEGEVHRLRLCPGCGPSSERVSGGAREYLEAFMAQGRPRDGEPVVFKRTTSTCPSCLALVDANVVIRAGRVFFEKSCARCGPSAALVCEDAAWYVDAYAFVRAGSQPKVVRGEARKGCPQDCGLCADHEQHTCIPLVEVTDHCNLDCPTCLVDNRRARHMTRAELAAIVDRLIAAEGLLESVTLSGGEPTSHPDVLGLIDEAARPEVGRVILLSNGLRIARDRAFAEALKAKGAYVCLQFDGLGKSVYEPLRGRDLTDDKLAALEVLERLDIPTQLIFTAARGLNEDQLGVAFDLLLEKRNVISLNVQPLAFTGRAGASDGRFDPMDRLTIPGVFRALEAQTGGRLRASDFYPLPCPTPHCIALTFLLKLDEGRFLPFSRFADLRRYGALLRNSAVIPALPEIGAALTEVIYDVFARRDELQDGRGILAALKRATEAMFPARPLGFQEMLRLGERHAKSIFVHHYMDPHDFDVERLRKCCNHYPQIDGRLMPACGFNLFHRGAAQGPGTPRAPWGRGPWGGEG